MQTSPLFSVPTTAYSARMIADNSWGITASHSGRILHLLGSAGSLQWVLFCTGTSLPGAHYTWETEDQIKCALGNVLFPHICPANQLFVPSHLGSHVSHWAHASFFSCHPGVHGPLFVVNVFGGLPCKSA